MNKRILLYLLLGSLGYLLFAFGVMHFYKDDPAHMDLVDRQEYNLKFIAKLSTKTPISKTAVIDHLGPPDITEAKEINKVIYQVMFYRTHNNVGDGFTTKDECTALLFVNNILTRWGSETYQQYLAYQ